MKTIRQRIDAMHEADRLYHKLDYAFPVNNATEEETAELVAATQAADRLDGAIIADWNAAAAAMKAADALLNRIDELSKDCYDMTAEYFVDDVLPDLAHGDLQAAIAKMEGNSHSRDEAMVEDKRYERDDIYKK